MAISSAEPEVNFAMFAESACKEIALGESGLGPFARGGICTLIATSKRQPSYLPLL